MGSTAGCWTKARCTFKGCSLEPPYTATYHPIHEQLNNQNKRNTRHTSSNLSRHKLQGHYAPSFCFVPLARIGIQTTKKAAVTATAQRCKAKCSALGLLHSRFCQDCSSTEVCQPDRQHRCTTEPQIPQERRIHRLQRPWDIGEHCFLNPRTPSQQHAAPLPRTSRLSRNR